MWYWERELEDGTVEERVLCEACGRLRHYEVTEADDCFYRDDMEFTIIDSIKAVCVVCGSEIDIPPVQRVRETIRNRKYQKWLDMNQRR